MLGSFVPGLPARALVAQKVIASERVGQMASVVALSAVAAPEGFEKAPAVGDFVLKALGYLCFAHRSKTDC